MTVSNHIPDLRDDPQTDHRLSLLDRAVLAAIEQWPGVQVGRDDIGFPTLSQLADGSPPLTLDRLVADGAEKRLANIKPQVFHAVARLEEFGYLPSGAIR